jgi:transcriptional regulator with XRE-family HTH domain
MGSAARRRPERLAEKLLEVRKRLGVSQNGMIRRMGLDGEITQAEVSMFERGIRVPSLPVLLAYASAANVYLEVLASDNINLPEKLPARKKSEGIKIKSVKPSTRKNSR